MRVGIHSNRRHNHPRLPKLISKCYFPCLRRYADSDSGSDLQQESLLDNDEYPPDTESCHMTGPDWGYNDDVLSRQPAAIATDTTGQVNQENREPTASMLELCTPGVQDNQLHADPAVTMTTTTPVHPLSDCSNTAEMNGPSNHGNSQLYQMPKFNGRMWQDGFGRFRRDTIPRRGEASPVPSHRESVQGDSNPGGPTWFISPMFTGLGSSVNNRGDVSVSQKSSVSGNSLMDHVLTDHDENVEPADAELWEHFENDDTVEEVRNHTATDPSSDNLGTTSSTGEDRGPTRPPRRSHGNSSQMMLPEHSSSLAQVLLSLPDQTRNNPYTTHDNQNTPSSTILTRSSQDTNQVPDLNVNQGHHLGINQVTQRQNADQGHPSVFDILERLQQHIQDSSVTPPPPEGVQVSASQNNILSGNHANSSHTGSSHGNDSSHGSQITQDAAERSNTSTVSSTWSNRALIQHILQALTNHSPGGSTGPRSPVSSQSSASNTSQRNWYFYDRRLVPTRSGDTEGMGVIQPPSYEEAQTTAINLNLPGINSDLLAQLGFLPGDPPPPYPGSDISPPPPYDCSSRSSIESFISELTSIHTESDVVDFADRFSPDLQHSRGRETSDDRQATLNLHLNFTMASHADNHSNEDRPPGYHSNQMQASSDHHGNQTTTPGYRINHTEVSGYHSNQMQEEGHHNQTTDHHSNQIIPHSNTTREPVHHNMSHDLLMDRDDDQSHAPQRSSSFGLGGRPPVRWNRGMGLDRWASTQNWGTEPSQ